LEGEAVFAEGRQRLLPWVILMRSSSALVRQVARAITELRNTELAAQFRLLGGLRYDKSQVADFLGKAGFMLSEEIIRESSFYRDILEEGLAKGRTEEARHAVAQVIAVRFPDLEAPTQGLAGLSLEALEFLLVVLLRVDDIEAARRELAYLSR
jgi:predicted transposase YdaD